MKGLLSMVNSMRDCSNGIFDRSVVMVPDCRKPETAEVEEEHQRGFENTNIRMADVYSAVLSIAPGTIFKFSHLGRR